MAELDEVMNNVASPVWKMFKIVERARKLGITKEQLEKMTEKEIQEKFGDIK